MVKGWTGAGASFGATDTFVVCFGPGEVRGAEDEEPSVIPGGVVVDVFGDEGFCAEEFGVGLEEVVWEAGAEPAAVGPDVDILGVEGEDGGEEVGFFGWYGRE